MSDKQVGFRLGVGFQAQFFMWVMPKPDGKDFSVNLFLYILFVYVDF